MTGLESNPSVERMAGNTMKTNQTKATISKKRWAAYAASGAAAVVTGAQTAEADITHIVLNDGAGTSMGVGGSEYFELVGNAAIHLFNTFNFLQN